MLPQEAVHLVKNMAGQGQEDAAARKEQPRAEKGDLPRFGEEGQVSLFHIGTEVVKAVKSIKPAAAVLPRLDVLQVPH